VPGGEFRILLKPNADLSKLNRPAFRKSPVERAIEDAEMQKLLDRGILEPSFSPCGISNVLVPKKHLPDGTPGGLRVTADLRAVNSVTCVDAFPTEDIGQIVDWLARHEWYSAVDLRDGYWNMMLAGDLRPYTAVITGLGLVQYTRMTMGLKNAGAFFQRLVNKTYGGLKGVSLQAYLDDMVIGSCTPRDHIDHVREILRRTMCCVKHARRVPNHLA
jgi:hypothetical protein